MPREFEPSANERAFVLQALREQIRFDGRSFEDFRDLQLTFGRDFGVVTAKLGRTKYAALHRPAERCI